MIINFTSSVFIVTKYLLCTSYRDTDTDTERYTDRQTDKHKQTERPKEPLGGYGELKIAGQAALSKRPVVLRQLNSGFRY